MLRRWLTTIRSRRGYLRRAAEEAYEDALLKGASPEEAWKIVQTTLIALAGRLGIPEELVRAVLERFKRQMNID